MRLSVAVTPRWMRKPDPGTDLDRTHPLCPDFCWPFLSPQGTAQSLGKQAKLLAPATRSDLYAGSSSMAPGGKYGLVVRHAASTDRTRFTAVDAAEVDKVLGLDGRFTVLLAYRKAAAATGGPTWAIDTAVSTASVFFNIPHTDNLLYWAYGNNQLTVSAAGVTFGDDLWAATAGARGMEIWQNGKLLASNATVPTRTSTSCDLRFNAWTGAYNPSGDLAFVMTWRRQLPPAAIRSLVINPWQVFQPPVWLAVFPTPTAAAGISGSQPAYKYAQGGIMRGGTSRGNWHSKETFVSVAGVQVASARSGAGQVDNETLAITESDGETPNTASFRARGFTPQDGQDVLITQGSINNLDRLFAGTILSDTSGYAGTPANQHDMVSAIDYSWQLTRETITQRWTNVSATVIAQAIIAHAGRGFTSRRVEAGLPVVDEFTVTSETHLAALKRLAERIGATVKPTYLRDVKFGITLGAETDPTILTAASANGIGLDDFSVTRDLSQVITRHPVEGGGSAALTEVSPGETILPVENTIWYNAAGGMVASGPQYPTYTGVQTGGAGTLVGPGATPAGAPALALNPGSGLGSGVYQYAYTDVTPSGESLPSPLATITTGGAGLADPADSLSMQSAFTVSPSGSLTAGTHGWAVTYLNAAGETLPSTRIDPGNGINGAIVGTSLRWDLTIKPGPSGTTARRFYLTTAQASTAAASTAQLKLVTTIPNNLSTTITISLPDSSLGANAPTVNSTTGNQVTVTGVAIGASPTTDRKLYRTAVNGSQLKLVPTSTTYSNNTFTGPYTDTTADGSLGANAPTSDTSALTQPAGQILAGATTVLVAGAGGFSATGGWARIGNGQSIRYTGISGNTLTGVPTSGPGAITATVTYNSTILAAPALTGIPATGAGSIVYTIRQGDPVNLRVVLDDLAAQAALATLIGGGDDGIIEGALISDGRISETEARARGLAQLALRKSVDVAVSLTSHDRNVRASRDQGVNLTQPACVGTFKLRAVTITNFHPSRWPTRQASAASTRFTLEDLLREAREAAGH